MSPTSSIPAPRAPETADLSRLVGVKLGNYRLERLVGRGRMGVVYLATDEALLRPTAVKVLAWSVAEARGHDPVQWFLAEARLVARINDPRVVQIYGAARHGDYCYIAMEYVAGASAEAMLARGERPSPAAATDILLQAASALHAAHRSGVVHRDVKPANLLVDPSGLTKLGDFGMALGAAGVADARARVGTPLYTAPEVWRGAGASPASDIYALGATYYHLLVGRPPYAGADVAAVEQAHLRAPIPDPRQLAPALPASCAALVRRALAKAPQERHPSAQELMWEARRVLLDLAAADGASSPGLPRGARAPAPGPAAHPAAAPPPGPLAEVMGFARRAFGEVDPADGPWQGEPHATARRGLLAAVEDEGTAVVTVTGGPGSGRSVLCRRVAAELSPARLVLYLDLRAEREERTLLQRLCRAAGAAEEGTEALEGLLRRLGEERRQRRPTPLLVLDGVRVPHPSSSGLAAVVAAGIWSRSFRLVLSGEPGLAGALAASGVDFRDERAVELELPALGPEQVADYVRAWIGWAQAPGAPAVILSPDAVRLLAWRSQGIPARVNVLAENMLLLAAAHGERTLSSWHAWTASERERWSGTLPLARLPRRAGAWPTPEAQEAIDACRRAAGLPPWPRGGSR